MKKKVLLLITKSVLGGAQKYVQILALGLREERYNVIIAASPGGWLENFSKEQNIDFFPVNSFKNSGKKQDIIDAFFDYDSFAEVINLIKHKKIDILHTNSTKAGFIGRLAGKILNIPLIIHTIHGLNLNEDLPWHKWLIIYFAERIAGMLTDHIIAVSNFDRESALKLKIISTKNISTIHNGISDKLFINNITEDNHTKEFYKKITENSHFKIIGTVANYSHNKGLEHLIDAADIITKETKSVKFVIVGDCRKDPILKKLNSSFAKDRILLFGPSNKIITHLSFFDIFVLPSIKEGSPFALLEAMAFGLPIVTTNVGGIPEMIENNKSGIIVPAKNPSELAHAIVELLSDKSLSTTMGNNAKNRQRNLFTGKNMVKETIKVYEKLSYSKI